MVSQSVMLSLFTEVVQMKYEIPTCEIVLLEQINCDDFLTSSTETKGSGPDAPTIEIY